MADVYLEMVMSDEYLEREQQGVPLRPCQPHAGQGLDPAEHLPAGHALHLEPALLLLLPPGVEVRDKPEDPENICPCHHQVLLPMMVEVAGGGMLHPSGWVATPH